MATTITANGINFPDGSAGSPSIGGTDTNTGLFTGSDIVGFATGGSERLRIDASGNIDIANDSGKLRLGTGNDLEIYHSGSNSFISDVGTGDLIITGTVIRPRTDQFTVTNAAANEVMIQGVADGDVELYYDNVKKLSTTSDGIEVHGSTDSARIEFGDAYSNSRIGYFGLNRFGIDAHDGLQVRDPSNSYAVRLTVDASGRVLLGQEDTTGIATSGDDLVVSNSGNMGITIRSTDGNYSNIYYADGGGNAQGYLSYQHSTDSLQFATAGSERMRISSTGKVGINNNNPDDTLDVDGTVQFTGNTYVGGDIYMYGNSYSGKGVFLGGSGSANKLDDYEEGTWTPTAGSGSDIAPNNPVGVYTKIGNMVHVQCYFSSNTAGNMAVNDAIAIEGLPFSRDSNVIPPVTIQINHSASHGSVAGGATVNTTPAITARIRVTTGHGRSGPGYQVLATYRVA